MRAIKEGRALYPIPRSLPPTTINVYAIRYDPYYPPSYPLLPSQPVTKHPCPVSIYTQIYTHSSHSQPHPFTYTDRHLDLLLHAVTYTDRHLDLLLHPVTQ